MQDEIDLKYYVSKISDPSLGIFFAIEDNELLNVLMDI